MADRTAPIAVVVLAGGEATRLPGKLFQNAGDLPLLVRVYRNVRTGRETFLSCKGALPYEIDLLIDAPVVIDRWPLRGPLSGLISTMSAMRAPWVFAVAGDAPFIDSAFIDALAAQIEAGDEAIVPRYTIPCHPERSRGTAAIVEVGGYPSTSLGMTAGASRIEPLAALYDRAAFLREGLPVLLGGDGSLHTTVERLRTRYVATGDARTFTNVNTPQEYDALRSILS